MTRISPDHIHRIALEQALRDGPREAALSSLEAGTPSGTTPPLPTLERRARIPARAAGSG